MRPPDKSTSPFLALSLAAIKQVRVHSLQSHAHNNLLPLTQPLLPQSSHLLVSCSDFGAVREEPQHPLSYFQRATLLHRTWTRNQTLNTDREDSDPNHSTAQPSTCWLFLMPVPDSAAAYLAMKSVLHPTPPPHLGQNRNARKWRSTNQSKAGGHGWRWSMPPDFQRLPGRLSPGLTEGTFSHRTLCAGTFSHHTRCAHPFLFHSCSHLGRATF